MEFGIGLFGDIPFDNEKQQFTSVGERLKTIIEGVKIADEAGLDVVSIGEHHRPDYAIASPEIILAALAPVTNKIILSSGVTVLSSSDPVKVYQDFSTIDHLSGGRAEITAGRGSFIESFPLFGQDLKDYDALFSEKLELLIKINQEERISWKGQFRPALNSQTVYPRAIKPDGIPIWVAVGGTPESVLRAATLGLPIIFAIIGGMPKQFKPLVEFYKAEYKRHGHDLSKMQIGVHSHTFLAASQEVVTRAYFPYYAAQMDRVGKSRGWAPYNLHQFISGMGKDGALFMGDAAQVTEKLIETIEMFGLTRFVAHIDVGAPDQRLLLKTIEIFANDVVPAVKKHLSIV